MKKNILFLFVSLFITTACLSQPRPVKNAESQLSKNNISLAKETIDEALNDPKAQEDGRSYLIKAKIYMAIFASEDPQVKALHPDPLNVALKAIEKSGTLPKVNPAMVKAEIMMLAGHFFNSGAINFDKGNHSRASLDLEQSFLLNKEHLNSIDTVNLFYAGISAQNAGEFDRAEGFYNQLMELNYIKPDLYSQLASLYTTQKDVDNAVKYIKLGREKFPDNLQLIFNEINVYLTAKDNDKAQEALALAISKDPENPNLYFVMGSNFNSMIDEAKTDEERVFAYNEAEKAYLGALEIDPDYFDATFNLGVLYFNEGSRLFLIADDLFRNYSRENERLGLEKEKQAREYWNKSEPLFLHAKDLLGINDPNTSYVSRSLRELYLRTKQNDKYQKVIEEFGLEE
jgi:Tfp pilus assembly protein PilF